MVNPWEGMSVLVTGACGTIGSELVHQLSTLDCKLIIGIDHSETELFFIEERYVENKNIEFFLCDLRDRQGVINISRDIDIILHAAALKHVVLCEKSPRDAVAINIVGMMNVIDAAQLNNVERVIFTSSDKAVNPTNVMGTTKLMGERLITAANAHRKKESDTIYASTRFGNVIGSRGSVVPIFHKQIKEGKAITITDNKMSRFVMTLKQAASLVLDSTFIARGGEVFVTKMPVVRIVDLADVLIDIFAPKYGLNTSDIEKKIIGSKPGEKLHEELLSDEEVRRTIELEKFFVITPAFQSVYQSISYEYGDSINRKAECQYSSNLQTHMTCEELKEYFLEHHIFDKVSKCE